MALPTLCHVFVIFLLLLLYNYLNLLFQTILINLYIVLFFCSVQPWDPRSILFLNILAIFIIGFGNKHISIVLLLLILLNVTIFPTSQLTLSCSVELEWLLSHPLYLLFFVILILPLTFLWSFQFLFFMIKSWSKRWKTVSFNTLIVF